MFGRKFSRIEKMVPGAGIIVLYIYLSNIYYMLLGVDI